MIMLDVIVRDEKRRRSSIVDPHAATTDVIAKSIVSLFDMSIVIAIITRKDSDNVVEIVYGFSGE